MKQYQETKYIENQDTLEHGLLDPNVGVGVNEKGPNCSK